MTKFNKIIMKIFIFLSVIFCVNIMYAQTLTYNNIKSGQEFKTKTVISKTDDGYIVKINDPNIDEQIYYTDQFFATLKWKYTDLKNGTDITAERSGNMIYVAGQFENKKYEDKIKINEQPWYQVWGLGHIPFVASNKNSTQFWSILPATLQIFKFISKKGRTEKIEVIGREIDSVFVKIDLANFLFRAFWGPAEIWFRKPDGMPVLLKMNTKDPDEFSQLVEEE